MRHECKTPGDSKSRKDARKVVKSSSLPYFDGKASPHAELEATKAIFPEGQAKRAAKILLEYLVSETQFWFRLQGHVHMRRERYDIQGTGIPCLVFVTYRKNGRLHCKVSLSGHDSILRPNGSLIVDFFHYLDHLIAGFMTRHINDMSIPVFELVDYESKAYSDLVDTVNYNRDGIRAASPHKPCGEKKAFCALFKECAEDENLTIGFEGFCAVALEVKPVTKKLKSRTKKRSVRVFGFFNRKYDSSLAQVRFTILPPCRECKTNACSYWQILDSASKLAHAHDSNTACSHTAALSELVTPPQSPSRKVQYDSPLKPFSPLSKHRSPCNKSEDGGITRTLFESDPEGHENDMWLSNSSDNSYRLSLSLHHSL